MQFLPHFLHAENSLVFYQTSLRASESGANVLDTHTITYMLEIHHNLEEDRQQVLPQHAAADATDERTHFLERLVLFELLLHWPHRRLVPFQQFGQLHQVHAHFLLLQVRSRDGGRRP